MDWFGMHRQHEASLDGAQIRVNAALITVEQEPARDIGSI
jgi:hypothetical protein